MESTETWTVYILKLSDGKHYVGCTSNLQKRLEKHQKGQSKYTSTRLPFKLISYFNFFDKYKAFFFEKHLKSGSGRAFVSYPKNVTD